MYANDYYEPGMEFINLDSTNKSDVKTIRKTKLRIRIRDMLTKYGLVKPNILCAILFKGEPSPLLAESLKKTGWLFKKLPLNPYL